MEQNIRAGDWVLMQRPPDIEDRHDLEGDHIWNNLHGRWFQVWEVKGSRRAFLGGARSTKDSKYSFTIRIEGTDAEKHGVDSHYYYVEEAIAAISKDKPEGL